MPYISNHHPAEFKLQLDMFEPVLTRNDFDETWQPNIYTGRTEDGKYSVTGGASFNHCLPYKGNEYFLGKFYIPDSATIKPFFEYQVVAARNGSKDIWHLRLFMKWGSDFYFYCFNPDDRDVFEKYRECVDAKNIWPRCCV